MLQQRVFMEMKNTYTLLIVEIAQLSALDTDGMNPLKIVLKQKEKK